MLLRAASFTLVLNLGQTMGLIWVLEALRGMFGMSAIYIWVLVGLKGMFGMSAIYIWVLVGLRGMFGTSAIYIWVLVGLKGMFDVFIGFALVAAPQNVLLGGFKKCAHTPKYYTTYIHIYIYIYIHIYIYIYIHICVIFCNAISSYPLDQDYSTCGVLSWAQPAVRL